MPTVGILSLGCPRNLTDSEVIAGSLRKQGFRIVPADDDPDIYIVNTCSFTNQAREESVEALVEAANLKKEGKIKYLVICGCLPQMFKNKLMPQLPEADLAVGTGDVPKIAGLVKKMVSSGKSAAPGAISRISSHPEYLYDDDSPRFIMTPCHYAYVKISEGCDNFCSYCVISRLRGSFRSRSVDSVVKEVEKLARAKSLKEINLIGQDTTLYGMDLYKELSLARLLKKICSTKNGVKWFRVLYTHPAHYTDELISVIRDEERICKYLDMPVQHISDKILRRMNRKTTKKGILTLIEKLRKNIPGLSLRTSLIVGFPGETEKDFKELLDFVKDARFERLGAFMYSREDGTPASRSSGQISEDVKKERFDRIMKMQQRISREVNGALKGKLMDVLIDEKIEGASGKFMGRTEADAPDIDGAVYVSGRNIRVGGFCKVRITDTMEYDLIGKVQ